MSNDKSNGFGQPTVTVKSTPTIRRKGQQAKWRFKCANCGGTSIQVLQWCHWDEDTQTWVFAEYNDDIDHYWCCDCSEDHYDEWEEEHIGWM